MKSLYVLSFLVLLGCATTRNTQEFNGIVETSCGECNFKMAGDDCDLAVKISGKYYFVEGSGVDEHGDAHAADGLCTVVRKAKVTGNIKHGVFYASSFELLPMEE